MGSSVAEALVDSKATPCLKQLGQIRGWRVVSAQFDGIVTLVLGFRVEGRDFFCAPARPYSACDRLWMF